MRVTFVERETALDDDGAPVGFEWAGELAPHCDSRAECLKTVAFHDERGRRGLRVEIRDGRISLDHLWLRGILAVEATVAHDAASHHGNARRRRASSRAAVGGRVQGALIAADAEALRKRIVDAALRYRKVVPYDRKRNNKGHLLATLAPQFPSVEPDTIRKHLGKRVK